MNIIQCALQHFGFFNVPHQYCEMGPTAYRPYPRRLEDVITMAALSPQLFKDPECWSGRGLNLRPPAQQSGALPTELTGRRLKSGFSSRRCSLTCFSM